MPLPAVITLVADEAYLPHVKSVMVNCRREGEWAGDFCLILPPEVDPTYFRQRGIYVLPNSEPKHFRKFAIFDPFFNEQIPNERGNPDYRWQVVLYLDADVLVQRPLEPLLHEVNWGGILADREMFTLEHAFTHWAKEEVKDPAYRRDMQWLRSNYDLSQFQYNTGIMVFNPRTIPPDTPQKLLSLQQRLAPVNTHVKTGTDQPILNLFFSNRFQPVRSDLFCYWQSAWDKTIVIHYCSGYAGWIKKGPTQNAYWNTRLSKVAHDMYLENLNDFEQVFPLCSPSP